MRTEVVVVGVDGSAQSHRALACALEEARMRGATCRIVQAIELPSTAMGNPYVVGLGYAERLDRARDALAADIRDWTEGAAVPVELHVAAWPPGPELAKQAKDAALLVVGSRGRGRLAEAVLGSVTQYCIRHASCPVLVVGDRVADDRFPAGRRPSHDSLIAAARL